MAVIKLCKMSPLLIFVFTLFLSVIQCFNLDPRIPIVKTGGADSESYFGYSVAQHRTLKSTDYGKPLLLVGAPRDQNLQPGTVRSGALWKCELTADPRDCTQVPTDGKRSSNTTSKNYSIYDGTITQLNPPISSEIKDGQWLGVDVKSQGEGGKVIICAHRYTVRDVTKSKYRVIDSQRGMLGMCYILEKDLTLPANDVIGYKNVMVARDAVVGKKLELRKEFDDHAKWGVCQVGTSATFVKPDDQLGDESDLALFGAPGCFTWRGNVFKQKVGTMQSHQVAVNHNSFLNFTKHGYMGMSVTSGKFYNNKMYYVTGAPQAGKYGSRTGEIYFFDIDTTVSQLQVEPDYTLRGEAFGAGFGYSLATLDANGDGWPDLLVGAPFYDGGKTGEGGAVYLYLSQGPKLNPDKRIKILGSQRESQFGLAISTVGDLNRDGYDDFAVGSPYQDNGGAVYIFFGGTRGISTRGPSDTFLKAESAAEQIITGAELKQNVPILSKDISTFGSSLSGGMDLDKNGYPDLLVGAYQSNMVFLLRSRPIIDITTFVDDRNLMGIDPGKAGCKEDPSSADACFGFAACFNVDKNISSQGLVLKFEIESEPKKLVSRVWLRLGRVNAADANRTSIVTDTIKINNGGQQHCTDIVGYVGSTHADLQTPVQFAMSYSLIQEEPKMGYSKDAVLPNINDFPILNQAEAKKRFQATFEKDCGSDDICQSQLFLTPILKDKTLKELGRTVNGEFYELELGSLNGSELILEIDIANKLEPAYEAVLDVFFPTAVSYIGLGEDTKLNAPELKNDTWLKLNLGNPLKGVVNDKPYSTKVQLRFGPKKNMADKFITFFLSANTSSEQEMDSSTFVHLVIVRRAEIKVVGGGFPEQVHYGERVLGQSAMSELTEIGPQLVQKFMVINSGPSLVNVLTVHIQWPFQVENGKRLGKWLLYLTDHPLVKNGVGACTLPVEHSANPLNFTLGHEGITARHAPFMPPSMTTNVIDRDFSELYSLQNSLFDSLRLGPSNSPDQASQVGYMHWPKDQGQRQRREVEKVIRPHLVKSANGEKELKAVTFDCDRGTAKCIHIKCEIYKLPAKVPVTIEVRSRLWNSTLAEDYRGIDFVEIYSKARVVVDTDISQDVSDDEVSVRTVAFPDKRQMQSDPFPEWWIVIASVIAGLLVLVIICIILWRLGFFVRKLPTEDEDDSDLMLSAHFEKVRLNGNSS